MERTLRVARCVSLTLVLACFTLAPAGCGSRTVNLAVAGDILLDRGVGARIERFGVDDPLQLARPLLAGADLAFANLECPLAQESGKVVKPFCFRASPAAAAGLARAGFDVLSLANNHTLDCGRRGLVETMDSLEGADLHWCGAGMDRPRAEAAAMVQANGLRVAFVGFCDFVPEGVFPRDDRPGVAFASPASVRRATAAARRGADVVVTSFHWGVEFASRPRPRQVELARAAVEAGADLVLGHHPHVLQAVEIRRRAGRTVLIAYSLGNFVFDQRLDRRAQSMVLRCTLGPRGVTAADAIPVVLDDHRPRPARPAEAETILARLAQLSRERGATISETGSIVLRP